MTFTVFPLQILHFAGNRITLLPVAMAELDSWEEVDAEGNDIL